MNGVHIDVLVFLLFGGGDGWAWELPELAKTSWGFIGGGLTLAGKRTRKTKPGASWRTSFSLAAPYDCCPAVLNKWDVRVYHLGGGSCIGRWGSNGLPTGHMDW